MPNWTDDEGRDWFDKIECKRCLQRFGTVDGEVPEHDCNGGRFKSGPDPDGVTHHAPIYVGPLFSNSREPKPRGKRCRA